MALLKNFCCCVPLRSGGIFIGVIVMIMELASTVIFWWDFYKMGIFHSFMIEEIIFCTLSAICCLFLIYGTRRNQRYFLFPYLVNDTIKVCSSLWFMIYIINFLLKEPEFENRNIFYMFISISYDILIEFCISVYFLICVLSLYQLIRDEMPMHLSQELPYEPVAFTNA